MTPADPTRRGFLAACAGTVAAGALPIPAVPAGAVTSSPPSLRISGLPPGSVVSLWRDVAEWFAGADEAGTAGFDVAKVPPGRYAVRWGFPESYAAGVVEVRSRPETGITVVVDYWFPLDPAADVP